MYTIQIQVQVNCTGTEVQVHYTVTLHRYRYRYNAHLKIHCTEIIIHSLRLEFYQSWCRYSGPGTGTLLYSYTIQVQWYRGIGTIYRNR